MLTTETKAAIRDVIRNRLSAAVIQDVIIEEGRDSADDAIIKISIVAEDTRALKRREMLSLTRHIRARLADEAAFPLIDFISAGDAKKRAAA